MRQRVWYFSDTVNSVQALLSATVTWLLIVLFHHVYTDIVFPHHFCSAHQHIEKYQKFKAKVAKSSSSLQKQKSIYKIKRQKLLLLF